MKNNLAMTVVIAIVVGALGFFGGMQYQKSQAPAGGRGQFGQRFGTAGQQGLRPVSGQILFVDDTGITVKARDGSSKIVIISASTSINKPTQAAKSDLKQGDTVAVYGTANSDGSITAQNVQINPMFGGGNRPTGAPQQ